MPQPKTPIVPPPPICMMHRIAPPEGKDCHLCVRSDRWDTVWLVLMFIVMPVAALAYGLSVIL